MMQKIDHFLALKLILLRNDYLHNVLILSYLMDWNTTCRNLWMNIFKRIVILYQNK